MATSTPRADSMVINTHDVTPPQLPPPAAAATPEMTSLDNLNDESSPELSPSENTIPDNVDDEPSPAQVQWRKNKQQLQRAAMVGDWNLAEEIFDRYPELMTERYFEGMTALLLAAKCGNSEFVEKLVNSLEKEQLGQMRDHVGRNVLHHAAMASDVSAAQAIVKKNPDLANAVDRNYFTPMFCAALWRHPLKSKEMLEYLYRKTHPKVYKNPKTAPSLIVAITASRCHGIALRILENHRKLVSAKNVDKWSILHILATQSSLFSSGRENSLLSPWVNFEAKKQQRKSIKDARELVDFICQQLQSFSNEDVMDYFLPENFPAILHLATLHGASELVEICLQYFPHLIWYTSSYGDKRLLLHVAIEHRQTKIYNLVMRLVGENAGSYAGIKVEHQNNILHLTANLAPAPELYSVPGPAFQMQRELQWFKAVESIVYTAERHEKNEDHFTPEELFFEKHGDLMKDAKEWMKDTSNSCMVVAALVATVAFASMITVPGGNNETGMPNLSNKKLFAVFSVANALSMISSAIALLMFLSIQTSRYTYKDFLELLPKNLVKGLIAVFVAVITMMIAFGTAIGLVLETRIKWVYIPITVVACIPAIIFTWLHLPLLTQTLVVTSGPVIYGHRRNPKSGYVDRIAEFLVPHDLAV